MWFSTSLLELQRRLRPLGILLWPLTAFFRTRVKLFRHSVKRLEWNPSCARLSNRLEAKSCKWAENSGLKDAEEQDWMGATLDCYLCFLEQRVGPLISSSISNSGHASSAVRIQ